MTLDSGGSYATAGVDLDAANRAKSLIKAQARSTFGPQVLTELGHFGGLFQFSGYREPVLVASADGVGTKLKIASAMDRHDTVGIDLVNHCVNDILTLGAHPLFFLDYIAQGKLVPEQVQAIVSGLAAACREVGCALIGGETAEMPGLYAPGDYDLAGFIVGVVEKPDIIDGSRIVAADILIGLPSSGLHTNGYSLVRRVFKIDERSVSEWNVYCPDLGRPLAEELLEPHRCYYSLLKPVLRQSKGLAHITGGGLEGNLPRCLPVGVAALVRRRSWQVPAIFRLIQNVGDVDEAEMFRVFNMGIGMCLVASQENVPGLLRALPGAMVIGEIVAGGRRVILE